MKSTVQHAAVLVCATLLVVSSGCSSKSSSTPAEKATTTSESETKSDTTANSAQPAAEKDSAPAKPFKLGDMIAPFTPPSLEEINKSAGWTDNPVVDGMDALRQEQEAAGPPPVTPAEALALRNDSPENNKKILDTLSRVAPADGKGVDYDASLVRHVAGDLKSSNPLFYSSITEVEYQDITGITLISADKDLKHIAPKDIVVSWQSSKDHLMDKFVLRDDLTWSDGTPVTAQDVKFSFQAIMTEAIPILAVRTGPDQIKWVEAYDDHTVVIFHKEALATNASNMAFPIVPEHVYGKMLADDPTMARNKYYTNLEDHPVVGGEYELTSRDRNREFVLTRRESYFMHDGKQVRAKPNFREVRVKVIEDFNTALLALKAGQIEQMELRPEQWHVQSDGADYYERNTKVYAPEWTEFHFVWNMNSKFFEDKRVRQAMSWAFDYEEYLHKISHDLYDPCQGTFHPLAWMFPKNGPEPYHQDLDKAEDLLDAAGWKDTDGDGIRDKEISGRRVPFEFTLLTYQTESGLKASVLMKECLGKIGITCNVKPTEFTVLVDAQQNHKFDAAMGGWGAGADPDMSRNLYGSGELRNYGKYSNKKVDELFEKGKREFDQEKRAAIYGEIHNILWEDQPYTWLFYRKAYYGFTKKVRGYNFAPTGPFDFNPGFDALYKPTAQ